jgi:hypothetical protein
MHNKKANLKYFGKVGHMCRKKEKGRSTVNNNNRKHRTI